MLTEILDHGPYSNELNWHAATKGLLESLSELTPRIVGARVELIGKCDLLVVVPWQQADLVSEKVGRETTL